MITAMLIIVCVVSAIAIWLAYDLRYIDGYYDAKEWAIDILFEMQIRSDPNDEKFVGRMDAIREFEEIFFDYREAKDNAEG